MVQGEYDSAGGAISAQSGSRSVAGGRRGGLDKAAEEEGHREESDSLAVLSTTRQDLCRSECT